MCTINQRLSKCFCPLELLASYLVTVSFFFFFYFSHLITMACMNLTWLLIFFELKNIHDATLAFLHTPASTSCNRLPHHFCVCTSLKNYCSCRGQVTEDVAVEAHSLSLSLSLSLSVAVLAYGSLLLTGLQACSLLTQTDDIFISLSDPPLPSPLFTHTLSLLLCMFVCMCVCMHTQTLTRGETMALDIQTSIQQQPVGARLVTSGKTMADSEDNVAIPEFNCLLQMDPYLKTYEKDFKRR